MKRVGSVLLAVALVGIILGVATSQGTAGRDVGVALTEVGIILGLPLWLVGWHLDRRAAAKHRAP